MHATPSQLRLIDPYHRWLGIGPEEQPPNLYRLLGLVALESDPEVIASAAEQRIAYVQGYLEGPEAEVAQQILAQLKLAQGCLLNPHRKRAYDQDLQPVPARHGNTGTVPNGSPQARIPTARPAAMPVSHPVASTLPTRSVSVPAVPTGSAVPHWSPAVPIAAPGTHVAQARRTSRRVLPEAEVSTAAAYRRRHRQRGQEGIIAVAVLVFLGLATMVWVMTQGHP